MKSTRSKSKDQVQKIVRQNEETWKEGIFEEVGFELRIWKLNSTKFFVEYTKDRCIKYIIDGCVVKEQKSFEGDEIIKNLEQVKYLRWKGELLRNQKKIGKWNAYWGGSNLNAGGYYNENGQKQGKWVELFENYYDLCKVTCHGIYNQGQKQGSWIYYYEDNQIAYGMYNENGQKNGTWVELHDYFSIENVVTFSGQYNNGVKCGKWNTYSSISINEKPKLIGGGEYNEQGIKNGSWVDTHENFRSEYGVKYLGKYQDGKKQGRWDIQFKNSCPSVYMTIGGGLYDNNEQKEGKWIELNDNFSSTCQIILEGEYCQGIKKNKWTTQFRLNDNHKFKIIGGGEYDDLGKKNGKWIDVINDFSIENQVIEVGDYQNGIRIGQWKMQYRYKITQNFKKIAGGSYDDQERKNEKWVEIFKNYYNQCQVALAGNYLNGHKIGKWDILFRYHDKKQFKSIGGGVYSETGLKNGQWTELIQNFRISNYVIMKGSYLDGKKQGQWDIFLKKDLDSDFKLIGGGSYDENGEKNGNWIDLNPRFGKDCGESQLVHQGLYHNGIRTKEFTQKNLYM